MGYFQHHPDGIIVIDALKIPLAFWLTQEAAYTLPEGYRGRIYEQGIRHVLYTANTAFPQPMPYAEGDTYIANSATYAAAYQQYLAAQEPVPTAEEIAAAARQSETRNQFAQLTAGLSGLSTQDRSYAILARIMAFKDGATTQTILAITNRATAVAYVQSKAEWTNLTAAAKAWEGDLLETLAGIVQVMLLVLE